MNKYLLGILGVVVLGGILWAGVTYPKAIQLVGATAGTTNLTARRATIAWNPQSNSASTTSILNSDSTNRIIQDTFIYCNNFGTSPAANHISLVTVQSATTTVANTGLQGNTNYASNFTFSTTTLDSYSATTTEGAITGTSRVWGAGKYLTFLADATTTAGTCTVGSDYINS